MNFIKPDDDLNFEISFFEDVISDNPRYTEALIALGDAYTRKGLYKKGLMIDKRLLKLKPEDPVIRYNLACSYSLLKKPDLCIKALEDSIRLGYEDFGFMQEDPDLAFIRKDPRFNELLSKYIQVQ